MSFVCGELLGQARPLHDSRNLQDLDCVVHDLEFNCLHVSVGDLSENVHDLEFRIPMHALYYMVLPLRLCQMHVPRVGQSAGEQVRARLGIQLTLMNSKACKLDDRQLLQLWNAWTEAAIPWRAWLFHEAIRACLGKLRLVK